VLIRLTGGKHTGSRRIRLSSKFVVTSSGEGASGRDWKRGKLIRLLG